jgi:hypothetical protein
MGVLEGALKVRSGAPGVPPSVARPQWVEPVV